jgi:hypothetical protein
LASGLGSKSAPGFALGNQFRIGIAYHLLALPNRGGLIAVPEERAQTQASDHAPAS